MNITKNQNTVQPKISSSCHMCSHYQFEGRRDGYCDALNVNVENYWESCFLFEFPFSQEIWQNLGIDNNQK